MAYMSSTVARNKYKAALIEAEGDLPPFEEWYAKQTEPKEEPKEEAASAVPETPEPASSVPPVMAKKEKEGFKIPTLDELLVRGVKKFMSKKEKK